MTFSLKKNRRNTRSYSGSSTPAPSRSTASRPNTRNRTKPVREKRQFSLWSKLQGGRVQRFFCVLLLRLLSLFFHPVFIRIRIFCIVQKKQSI